MSDATQPGLFDAVELTVVERAVAALRSVNDELGYARLALNKIRAATTAPVFSQLHGDVGSIERRIESAANMAALCRDIITSNAGPS